MSLLRRLEFSFWYLGTPPWDTGISPPELLAFLDGHAAGRAIDLGCGTGTNVITMAQRGWEALGVDFAPNAIRRARKKIAGVGARTRVYVGDVTRLTGINGPFDFALDLGCFHGLAPDDKHRYLARLQSILRGGGHWMVYGRLKADDQGGRFGLTPQVIELIKAHFTLISQQDGFHRGSREPSAYWLLQKPQS
jgi:cyclopropane fatty-acyl-phospholipid synthase-like methyltransferase